MNVFGTTDAAGEPISIACPHGLAYRGGRPAKAFRPVVGRNEPDRLCVCDERESVLVREAPEEVGREC